MEGLKIDDNIDYKLIETKEESIIIVYLDIKRKGVPIPALGPKMRVVRKYTKEQKFIDPYTLSLS